MTSTTRAGLDISLDRLMPTLTPEAEVAVLARALYREGWNDGPVGHISYKQPDGTYLVTPLELSWYELSPDDVMRMDEDGRARGGRWTITPAIALHVEAHRARPDVTVVVHQHPQYATIWSTQGTVPPAYEQTGAGCDTERIQVLDEYLGPVDDVTSARENIKALGDRDVALLANHGALVVADTIATAFLRARWLEARCRAAWMITAVGGGAPMKLSAEREYVRRIVDNLDVAGPMLWAAAVRRELWEDRDLLKRRGSWWGDDVGALSEVGAEAPTPARTG